MRFWPIFVLLFLTSCIPNRPSGEGSVLIFAIPHFRADDFDCRATGDSATPRISQICSESVRFTHAYTPSLIENAALASLLTGLYPVEHGVRSNAASIYEDGVVSLATYARQKGLVTIFVSGGVPALRKSAISEGFDDFDDSVREQGSYYRPAQKSARRFLSLVESRAQSLSFFSVVEFSDLLFSTVASSQDTPGVIKEGTVLGKLQDIDEGIGLIKSRLERLKIWDATTVIVAGLQGTDNTERDGYRAGVHLYDDSVRIPLLIKPSRKPKDKPPGWKVDDAVSLVDVGHSLFELLKVKKNQDSDFPLVSVMPLLQGETMQKSVRPIFSENTLPLWRGWGSRLFAVRSGEWLYWPEEKKLFNTYTDRYQMHNLAGRDTGALLKMELIWEKYKDRLEPNPYKISDFLPSSVAEKLRIAEAIFSENLTADEKIKELQTLRVRRPDDWQVMQWLVSFLVETGNWPELHATLKSAKPKSERQKLELGVWSHVIREKAKAKANFGKIKDNQRVDCLKLASSLRSLNLENAKWDTLQVICPDQETDLWLRSFYYHKLGQAPQAQSSLESAKFLTDRRREFTTFAQLFWIAGACWDFDSNLPDGPAFLDLFLLVNTNPEFQEYVNNRK